LKRVKCNTSVEIADSCFKYSTHVALPGVGMEKGCGQQVLQVFFFLGNSSFSNLRSTLYWTLVCWCCFETL